MIIERMFHINLTCAERDTLRSAWQILQEIGGEMEEERLDQIIANQSDLTSDDLEFVAGVLEDIANADSLKAEI